jgi:tetratricopeptide (TPR) repeat protein
VAGEVDERRAELARALRAVCEAERRDQIDPAQARARTSCLERRGFELDAAATHVVSRELDTAAAGDILAYIPPAAECVGMTAPPLAADRAPVAALYRRLIEVESEPLGSPKANVALAAIEREARALGDRELEARSAVRLGMRQIETDQLAAADATFARAHDVAIAIGAPFIAMDALVERGIAAGKRGDPAARHAYTKLAAELADKSSATAGTRAFVYRALAHAEYERGQPGRAIELAEKTLALLRTRPPDPWLERNTRDVLIKSLHLLGGQEARALELARENLELARKTLGERDPDYGAALDDVATALGHTGDHAATLDHRRRALAVTEAGLPAGHSAVLELRMNVARDLHANGRFEEARAEGLAHLALAEKNESLRQTRSISVAEVGIFTFATGRIEEGIRLFEQGLQGAVSHYGQDHPEVLDYRLERVRLDLELGRLDDAERHIDALERSYRARTDQARALARLDGIDRAELALARGRPRDAEARARAALATWRELRGDQRQREDLFRILGASLVDQRRWNEALEALATAESIARARRSLGDRFARIDIEKARALSGLGRKAEARALAGKARETLERFPGQLRARAAADALLGRRKPR